MLPLAHTYVSTKATNRKDPLLILGSILPDIATTSSQVIDRKKIHDQSKELYNFISSRFPNLVDLGLGVRLHSPIDGGADFYTDDHTVGYAYLNGRFVSEDVAKLLAIPNNEKSLVLSHNFIELAIDLHLFNDKNEIFKTYKKGIEESKRDFPIISQSLGNYLNLESSVVLQELNKLITFLSPKNITSIETAVKNIIIPLIKLRLDKTVSGEKTIEIITKALEITKPTYQQFLNDTVLKVKHNILIQ